MKNILIPLLTVAVAGLLNFAAAQDNLPETNNVPPHELAGPETPPPGETNGNGETPPGMEEIPPPGELPAGPEAHAGAPTNLPPVIILPGQSRPAPVLNIQTNFVPPAAPVGTNNPDELRMNFQNAPLDMVLQYLSDAAGFIVVLDTRVNGNFSVISAQPMTRDQAVDLLNSVLNKNGYAAIRNGRMLTIVDKNDAKTRDIPVKLGNDPAQVPNNAEIVTQIIPIRFVEARQLASDLTAFVSPQATVVANEAANAIVITDTQANIKHLMEIIASIDNSARAETEIRVFRLKYANPTDVATELGSVFPNSTSGSGPQAPVRFGGRGNFFARMMQQNAGGGENSSAERIQKATQVTAVADARIQAVIVTAPKDLMEQIAAMMTDLDVPSARDQGVYVFQMQNGDPQQAAQVLQNMFQSSGTSRGGSGQSSQNSLLQQRAQNAINSMGTPGTGSTGVGGNSGIGGSRGIGGGRQF